MWFVLNKPDKKSQGVDVNLVVSLGEFFFLLLFKIFMPNFDLPKYVRYKPQISSAQRLALKKKKNHDTCKKVCNTRITHAIKCLRHKPLFLFFFSF